MPAALLAHSKLVLADGAVVEVKVWRVPSPVPPSLHDLKYSLFYGHANRRLVAYDNERGKGDHRHYDEREEAYAFTTLERLLDDFRADVERIRGEPI